MDVAWTGYLLGCAFPYTRQGSTSEGTLVKPAVARLLFLLRLDDFLSLLLCSYPLFFLPLHALFLRLFFRFALVQESPCKRNVKRFIDNNCVKSSHCNKIELANPKKESNIYA